MSKKCFKCEQLYIKSSKGIKNLPKQKICINCGKHQAPRQSLTPFDSKKK